MTHQAALAAARAVWLDIVAALNPAPGDEAPEGCGTLLLLGPREPGFWPVFTASPEYGDGAPHPLDRWSRRVVTALAATLGGAAIFPSDGPPYPPFFRWAVRSGHIWSSPVQLLVHGRAGLMVSFRGAVAVAERIALPGVPPAPPCTGCARPCLEACPVGALTGDGYDVEKCHEYLETQAGADCLSRGCLVRRACPVSQGHGRLQAQAAFHMRAFHP